MKLLASLLLSLFSVVIIAQEAIEEQEIKHYYWVNFKDKLNTPFQIDHPEQFLSPRAIERRKQFNIPIEEKDLPVNANYLDSIRQSGVKIHLTSRWFNAAAILCTQAQMDTLQNAAFITEVKKVGSWINRPVRMKNPIEIDTSQKAIVQDNLYGRGSKQIEMLNGHLLHQKGYQGQGKMIAVLDGGFFQLDIIPFYDSLRNRNGFVASKDFVEGDSIATEASMHGTQVLSTMAAYMPGVLVGTAPGANYICAKTEDVRGENLIEVCNWVAGLEYADSLGADLVNSSLGYNTFDDKSSSYTYEQMDGISTLSSIAADIAFEKGMIIITSVGNEGHHKWKYLDAPADAINILAVGAVDSNNERAYFSSIGPTADGRIKPEISALGLGVQAASVRSLQTTRENGTSLSAPILTGLIACLWQAYPDKSNKEIIEAVLKKCLPI